MICTSKMSPAAVSISKYMWFVFVYFVTFLPLFTFGRFIQVGYQQLYAYHSLGNHAVAAKTVM
jgi:hypothetical protein